MILLLKIRDDRIIVIVVTIVIAANNGRADYHGVCSFISSYYYSYRRRFHLCTWPCEVSETADAGDHLRGYTRR